MRLFLDLWMQRNVFVTFCIFLFSILGPAEGLALSHFPPPAATNSWSEFYGTVKIDGVDAQPGDEIAFYDSTGILCGSYVLQKAGEYGVVHVYGDDLTTSGTDEGASPGETLSVRIWDSQRQAELSGGTLRLSGGIPRAGSSFLSSPVPPVWQDNSGYALNVDTTSHFPLPTSTPLVANYAGSLTISGSPASVGDEVAVFDPNGILCGHFRVNQSGQYGAVQVYGDDTTTAGDEGAVAGDALTFKVWIKRSNTEYAGRSLTLTTGAAQSSFVPSALPPVWQPDTGYLLNIAVGTMTTNSPPVAIDGAAQTRANTPLTGTLAASDPDGDALTLRILTTGSKGNVTITNAATGAFSYVPHSNLTGMDFFTFAANDGSVDSNTATFNITIVAGNNPPVANDGAVRTSTYVPVNGALAIHGAIPTFAPSITGALVATDPDENSLTFRIVTNSTKGTAIVTNAATGAFSYQPQPNLSGADFFTFVANDGVADSNTATVHITVAPPNHPPIAADKIAFTKGDAPITQSFSAYDTDEDPLTFSLGSTDPRTIIREYLQREHANGYLPDVSAKFSRFLGNGHLGQLIITNPATGEFQYTPNADVSGTDFFTFHVSDGIDSSKPAFVTFTIDRNLQSNFHRDGSVNLTNAIPTLKGDMNGDFFVDLADAILALKSAISFDGKDHAGADVDNDGQIGLPEAIYILQRAASLR